MNKTLNSITAFACAATLVTGAAFAQEERNFDLEEFDRIDISAGLILVADVGGPQSVTVKTEHGDFTDFKIRVKDGTLRISRDHNRLRWHSKKSSYKVIVSTPELRAFDASSGTHSKITNISSARFTADLSSGAHASLEGSCADCTIDLSSGAHLDAKNLACESANIDVSSGGHGKITASRAVVADASSGGHFTIYGNPQRVSIDKSSGGRVSVASRD